MSSKSTSLNFRCYWNGDLQDELLDGDIMDTWNGNGMTRLLTLYNYGNSKTCNSTKKTPNLTADLLGDWREEIILWDSSDGCTLNIFTTNSNECLSVLVGHVARHLPCAVAACLAVFLCHVDYLPFHFVADRSEGIQGIVENLNMMNIV